MNRDIIFEEIEQEREYQDNKWGLEFDNKNTYNDWMVYVSMYLGDGGKMKSTPAQQRIGLLKAATLCVAALESFDRNGGLAPRHYDKKNENND